MNGWVDPSVNGPLNSLMFAPVVAWDNQPIGDGKPGPVSKALLELLDQDMRTGRDRLIDVPY